MLLARFILREIVKKKINIFFMKLCKLSLIRFCITVYTEEGIKCNVAADKAAKEVNR